MKTLTVGLSEKKYDILIGDGMLDDLGSALKPFHTSSPISIVTDENVWWLYRERFASSLSRAGVEFAPTVLPPGERNKSLDGLAGLYETFAQSALSRDGLVLAFGGGVVGDLCGFAAATWMRGVSFAQVPTTLLAQVDSSVGGKTAINLPQGKNLVGAFYQPKIVLIDPSTLASLPEREIRCGMSEVIKYGAIRSSELFHALAEKPDMASSDVIGECCRIKSEIVSRDERDFGERMLLNFGHTLGHAIETQSGFELYRHGEAVAYGMVLAARMGEWMGITEPGTSDALRDALTLHGLETDYPGKDGDLAGLLPSLGMDKKNDGGGVRMIMLRRIGDAFVRRVDFADIKKFLEAV
jgi:3-dehydroquinate synthase